MSFSARIDHQIKDPWAANVGNSGSIKPQIFHHWGFTQKSISSNPAKMSSSSNFTQKKCPTKTIQLQSSGDLMGSLHILSIFPGPQLEFRPMLRSSLTEIGDKGAVSFRIQVQHLVSFIRPSESSAEVVHLKA